MNNIQLFANALLEYKDLHLIPFAQQQFILDLMQQARDEGFNDGIEYQKRIYTYNQDKLLNDNL